jgi:hypothetical protein
MAQEKWEYLTEFVWANLETQGVKEYLRTRWPSFKPDKFAPETMMPQLNTRGETGWELVHMQPVSVGRNSDVSFASDVGGPYTNIYFCVFKRRRSEQGI